MHCSYWQGNTDSIIIGLILNVATVYVHEKAKPT